MPASSSSATAKQRDKELEALRTRQRKVLENEAKLKREIELMGDDRRKFNEQIIDTAARVSGVEERIAKMGIKDKKKIYEAEDLAPGKQLIFAATGVTEGALLKGVRFFGEGTRTSSVILTLRTGKVRFIESIHLEKGPDVKVRFA